MKSTFALLAMFLFAACSSSGSSSSAPSISASPLTPTTLSAAQTAANAQARKNVKITSCAPNGSHHLVIKGTAHNASTTRATYDVQLSINSKAGKPLYGTAASASDVAPGKTAPWSAVTSAAYVAGMTCTVTSVSVHPTS